MPIQIMLRGLLEAVNKLDPETIRKMRDVLAVQFPTILWTVRDTGRLDAWI